MSWQQQFEIQYASLLDIRTSGIKRGLIEGHCHRARGFGLIFELLLAKRSGPFDIIETGTLRNPGNWKDGQSSRLFAEFTLAHGGRVRSVDIDPVAVSTAEAALNHGHVSVTCSDSVSWLSSLTDLGQVDLFYLDSWDVKWKNDQPSAQHHFKEFQIIEPYLSTGTVVAIDDNSRFASNQRRIGKGRMIVEYLEQKNIVPIYDAYQIIYQF
jgi:predicted O-methyltransferase YrrM